jgi:hypothetical protein
MRDASRDCVPCTAATGLPYHLARRDDFDRFCRQPPLGRSLRVGGMRGKLQLVARVHGFVSKRYKPFTLDKGNETKNSNLKGGWTRGVAMNAMQDVPPERRLDEGFGHECKTERKGRALNSGLTSHPIPAFSSQSLPVARVPSPTPTASLPKPTTENVSVLRNETA